LFLDDEGIKRRWKKLEWDGINIDFESVYKGKNKYIMAFYYEIIENIRLYKE